MIHTKVTENRFSSITKPADSVEYTQKLSKGQHKPEISTPRGIRNVSNIYTVRHKKCLKFMGKYLAALLENFSHSLIKY